MIYVQENTIAINGNIIDVSNEFAQIACCLIRKKYATKEGLLRLVEYAAKSDAEIEKILESKKSH